MFVARYHGVTVQFDDPADAEAYVQGRAKLSGRRLVIDSAPGAPVTEYSVWNYDAERDKYVSRVTQAFVGPAEHFDLTPA